MSSLCDRFGFLGFFLKILSTSIITEIITSISFFNLKTHTSVQLLNVFMKYFPFNPHLLHISFLKTKYLWNVIVIEVFSACITAKVTCSTYQRLKHWIVSKVLCIRSKTSMDQTWFYLYNLYWILTETTFPKFPLVW